MIGGTGGDDTIDEDAAFFGLTVARQESAAFELWAQNAPAVAAFMAVFTQLRFRTHPQGLIFLEGLDYAGARAGLSMAGIEVTPELWAEVQLVEAGAIKAWTERHR